MKPKTKTKKQGMSRNLKLSLNSKCFVPALGAQSYIPVVGINSSMPIQDRTEHGHVDSNTTAVQQGSRIVLYRVQSAQLVRIIHISIPYQIPVVPYRIPCTALYCSCTIYQILAAPGLFRRRDPSGCPNTQQITGFHEKITGCLSAEVLALFFVLYATGQYNSVPFILFALYTAAVSVYKVVLCRPPALSSLRSGVVTYLWNCSPLRCSKYQL